MKNFLKQTISGNILIKNCNAKAMLVWYHYIIRNNILQLLTMYIKIIQYI